MIVTGDTKQLVSLSRPCEVTQLARSIVVTRAHTHTVTLTNLTSLSRQANLHHALAVFIL